MKNNLFIVLTILTTLTGCSSLFTSPDHQVGRDSALPVLNIQGVKIEQQVENYANQLASSSTNYASIRTYPYADFTQTGLFAIDPIRVLRVDDTWLKNIPSSFLGYGADYVKARMATTELKLPSGSHKLLLTGTGGTNEAKYTQLPNVNFESGKHYILKPKLTDAGIKVQLYEYKTDDRFEETDKDRIFLQSAIGEPVSMGNISPEKISTQFPRLNNKIK